MIQLIIILTILVLCIIILVIRFILGPSVMDRLAVLEGFTPVILCIASVWGVMLDVHWFFDVVLVLGLIGFLSTVAAVKFAEQGNLRDD